MQMLLNERPLIILPSLAKALGVAKAVILQQIHFVLSQSKSGIEINGEKWIWNTYEEWHAEHFSFMSLRSVKQYFRELEEAGLIVSCQPNKTKYNHTKYYKINHQALDELCTIDSAKTVPIDSASYVPIDSTEFALSIKGTETSSETSAEREKTFALTSENQKEYPEAPEAEFIEWMAARKGISPLTFQKHIERWIAALTVLERNKADPKAFYLYLETCLNEKHKTVTVGMFESPAFIEGFLNRETIACGEAIPKYPKFDPTEKITDEVLYSLPAAGSANSQTFGAK